MQKNLQSILICFALIGCGDIPHFDESHVEPYAEAFLYEAHSRGRMIRVDHVRFEFVDSFPGSTVAYCTSVGGFPTVLIKRSYWASLSDLGKEKLVFHELGHCVLGMPHVEDRLHIMNADLISVGKYQEFRDEFIDDLFNPY